MRHFIALMIGLFAGQALAQNSGTPAALGNAADNDSGLQQLSPVQRPGRRGGVVVLGSTNPYSLRLSNNVGATGSNVRTNTGGGSSSNRTSIVVTNNGVVSTNVITNVPPGEIVYPPPIIPGLVPPGTAAPGTGANPAAGAAGAGNIVLPPPGVVTPPPPITAPPGIAPPQGETALPPSGTATPPQGTPTPPPPIAPPARSR